MLSLRSQPAFPSLCCQAERRRYSRVGGGLHNRRGSISISILLSEHAERHKDPPEIQVFATDIDEQAIAEARDGHYPL